MKWVAVFGVGLGLFAYGTVGLSGGLATLGLLVMIVGGIGTAIALRDRVRRPGPP